MKRFIKLVTLALLVAALISQWRRVRELLRRQGTSTRSEGPGSEALHRVSRLAAGVGQATQRVGETTEEAGEPESRAQEATPTAERRAQELGVDLSRVEGTGSGGRITVKDVQRSAAQRR
jgi:pyruvate/2-oxoglutarate dehydrogenase complex dihydrolipoamide acyltransferase (E2) component